MTYLAIIDYELFSSKDKITWTWINQSVVSMLSGCGWYVSYDDVHIVYVNGIYKLSKTGEKTLISHNGQYWI